VFVLEGWEASDLGRQEVRLALSCGKWVKTYDSPHRNITAIPPNPELDRSSLSKVRPEVFDGTYWVKAAALSEPQAGEVRVVNEKTGGEKGKKACRIDLIPAGPLWKVGELYGAGARKYQDHNWRRGYDWSLSLAALFRHLFQWVGGEKTDDETGGHHLASVCFHAMALMEFEDTHPELDDRWMIKAKGAKV